MFRHVALLVLRKDVSIEVKSLEILSTTLFFAIGCVIVFAFALVKEGQAPPDAAAEDSLLQAGASPALIEASKAKGNLLTAKQKEAFDDFAAEKIVFLECFLDHGQIMFGDMLTETIARNPNPQHRRSGMAD